MTRLALVLIPFVALAACDEGYSGASRGAVVPYPQVLAENAARPWECLNYDRATDSCEAIGRSTLQGNRFVSDGSVGRSAGRGGSYRLRGQGYVDAQGRGCFRPGDLQMSVAGGRTTEEDAFIIDFTREVLKEIGETCTTTYRQGDHYIVESRAKSGQMLPDGRKTLHFFASPKRLRSLG